jgi:hypothetical protein
MMSVNGVNAVAHCRSPQMSAVGLAKPSISNVSLPAPPLIRMQLDPSGWSMADMSKMAALLTLMFEMPLWHWSR